MINENFLICLVGIPASGKSTFAEIMKNVIEERLKDFKVVVIDPDMIREGISPGPFDWHKEQLVRKMNLQTIRDNLEQGKIVISDDLNYYISMRHDLKVRADLLNLNFYIIFISTPLEICFEWNRIRDYKVPNSIVLNISEKLDLFNRYRWDTPINIIDLSEINDVKKEANRTLDLILEDLNKKIQISKDVSKTSDKQRLYNESLDKITRKIVGKLLKNPDFIPLKTELINSRKNFVKSHSNLSLDDIGINKTFQDHLTKTLKVDIPSYIFEVNYLEQKKGRKQNNL